MLEEVRARQTRPLDPIWAVVFLDAIIVKVRPDSRKAVEDRRISWLLPGLLPGLLPRRTSFGVTPYNRDLWHRLSCEDLYAGR